MSKVIILIPARYSSSRFPGKPLALIKGRSMISRVFSNCEESGFPSYVVTDHQEIEDHVKSFGGNVIRINDDVPSGSERIALAYARSFAHESTDLIINVQGDEPLLSGKVLKELAQFHLSSQFDIATLIRERSSDEVEFKNPNVVKAVFASQTSECLYFSRQSLPFSREGEKNFSWHQHIGVYSYRPTALLSFVNLPLSRLEDLEKLEQLRALENGMAIGAILTSEKLIGVDVPEDIKKVEDTLV